MKRIIKHMIPLPVRTFIKYLGFASHDIASYVSGSRAPKVPPLRHTFIGTGDFICVGEGFLKTLTEIGNLQPHESVLDVGCGQGRMALPLINYLDQKNGHYTGIEIVRSGVNWCNQAYSDYPNFSFIHADVYNKRYNQSGKTAASEYVFPFEDNSFDLVFLTSVFTHMLPDDVENYIAQIARCLKQGGRCLVTFFLLNNVSEKAIKMGISDMDFRYDLTPITKTTVKSNPEAAIAFDETHILGLFTKYGLKVGMPIHYGKWARPDTGYDYQDMIVATKL